MKFSFPPVLVVLAAATIAFGGNTSSKSTARSHSHQASVKRGSHGSRPKASLSKPVAKKSASPKGARSMVAEQEVTPMGSVRGKMCAITEGENPPVCHCAVCDCDPNCWCHTASSGGDSTSGSTAGSTAGSTSGTTTDGTTTAGTTSGTTTTGSTTSGTTTATTAGTSSGDPGDPTNGGGTSAGDTSAGGTTSGSSTGTSTGGDAPSPTGGGAGDGWDGSASSTTPDDGDLPDGSYVSGTNVNYTSTLRLQRSETSVYTAVYVASADLKVGGEVDSVIHVPVGQALSDNGNGLFVLPTRVRFASTRFKPNAVVALNAVFHCQLSNPANPNVHEKNVDYTLTTFHVVAYNQGLAWLTKQIANTQTGLYQTVDPPQPADYNWGAKLAIDDSDGAVARLVGMRHATPTVTTLKAANILSGLKESTAILAYTHGEADARFLASWGDVSTANGSTDYRALSFAAGRTSEVGKAVLGEGTPSNPSRTVPPINLAIFHACSLSASGHNLAYALDIEDQGTMAVAKDRACAGFPYVVYTELENETYVHGTDPQTGLPIPPNLTKHYLPDHAKLVYSLLAQGQTIQQALNTASDAYHPARRVGDSYAWMKMQFKGDANTRLISVYTGNDNSPANPLYDAQHPNYYPYRWYLVNP